MVHRGLLGLAAVPFLATAAMAELPQDFVVDTAADFVALCSVQEEDPNYIAAISFCRGYAHGALQLHEIKATAIPALRVFCVPDPAPTRAEAWGDFLEWIGDNPDYLDGEALDALFTFLAISYPCG